MTRQPMVQCWELRGKTRRWVGSFLTRELAREWLLKQSGGSYELNHETPGTGTPASAPQDALGRPQTVRPRSVPAAARKTPETTASRELKSAAVQRLAKLRQDEVDELNARGRMG